jgi:hypothetical protein
MQPIFAITPVNRTNRVANSFEGFCKLMAEEHIQPAIPSSPQGVPGSPARAPDAVAAGPPPAPPSTSPPIPSVEKKKKAMPEVKDSPREVVETIVFVVVLVLLLKTFLAEAFVIPTGSMATTLLGYHKTVTCEQCNTKFLVNLSGQVDPDFGDPRPVTGGWCPNCHYYNPFPNVAAKADPEDRP